MTTSSHRSAHTSSSSVSSQSLLLSVLCSLNQHNSLTELKSSVVFLVHSLKYSLFIDKFFIVVFVSVFSILNVLFCVLVFIIFLFFVLVFVNEI